MAIFDGQRNVTWTEALRPGASAIAKSHGIATSVEISTFPVDCTTVEISTFLFGRPDRLPFATMWPCLFHKSVDSKDEDFALQLMQSGAYVQKALSLRDSSGVEHHPANILRPLLKEALSGTKKR